MSGYIAQILDGTHVVPGILSTLWMTGRVHLLVLFLGFSLLGTLCLPVVAGVRGFYLSFSIAAFIRAFGLGGWPVAFVLFGAGALITVPCFFLLATQAFATSANLGRSLLGGGKLSVRTLYSRAYVMRTAFCVVGLLSAVLVELYLTPVFVRWMGSGL